MNVLVACEYSGIVRDAFIAKGHRAVSCDLLPSEAPGPHYQGDVFDIIDLNWDLMIAHPPCTFLAGSGAKHLYMLEGQSTIKDKNGQLIRNEARWDALQEGAEFFRDLWEADIPRIAVENPKMMDYAKTIIGRGEKLQQTQMIQPWQFGHGEVKGTCLWLKGLPPLEPTNVVSGRVPRVHMVPPGEDRWKIRSTTYPGIAEAMADQWGSLA